MTSIELPYLLEGKIEREWLERKLYIAFMAARKRKLATKDEYSFEMNWRENISLLADDILRCRYKPSRGIAFIVKKPVIREIFAAPFRDRVVHHFLYNMVADWWDKRLIYNSFSCRKGKGVLFGVKRLDKDIKRATQNYTVPGYVIKMDIQGYFMSLSRDKLFERVMWGLKRQYKDKGPIFQLLKYLWYEIIFDDPVRGVKLRPPISAWNELPENKSLLHQPDGRGIVIGNLSSQLLSNIYLDQLDRFITMRLGYKYYGRYVDDFYIVVPEGKYAQAKKDVKVIEDYLLGIGLVLHPNKRYIQNVDRGVAFLGMVIYPYRIVPGRRFKESFYRAAYEYEAGLRKDEAIISYLGYCKHLKGRKLCQKVFNSVGWEYTI
ncbi:RNA-directed DNA polymerase [Candidatus Saccharibacteria bacterium]|nr:RNA-directed DNA polymerase [Candidatus Saccharibacteria bacterium]